jgi:hypothetical protein
MRNILRGVREGVLVASPQPATSLADQLAAEQLAVET